MPRRDLRTGNVAMESLSKIDSAGSCESVISANSAFSEDSMEHLSAEERACLMYFEETIEALEVQEDSGFSNDEPEWLGKPGGTEGTDVSSSMSESDKDEHQTLNHTTKTETHPGNNESVPTLPPSASPSRVLCVTTDASGHPKIITNTDLHPAQSSETPENNLGLIPPPSDFMDKPNPHADQGGIKDSPQSAGLSTNPSGAAVEPEQLRQRVHMGKESPSAIYLPPEVPHVIPDDRKSPLPEHTEPKSPPAVAPKPKKLPANIIRKTLNVPATSTDSNLGHLVPSEKERVHMEALRKLGLLKGDETDSSPVQSPKGSPKTKSSWRAPPSPVSPASPRTPTFNPSNLHVHSPPPVSVPLPVDASSVNSKVSDILPVPAAFSDPIGHEAAAAAKNVLDVNPNQKTSRSQLSSPSMTRHPAPPIVKGVKSATLERSGPGLSSLKGGQDFNLASQLRKSRPRPASLGSGKEFTSTQGKDVEADSASSPEPGSRRSAHAHLALQHSQKLPRAGSISVLICPRSENEEARRNALKKLGLLRD